MQHASDLPNETLDRTRDIGQTVGPGLEQLHVPLLVGRWLELVAVVGVREAVQHQAERRRLDVSLDEVVEDLEPLVHLRLRQIASLHLRRQLRDGRATQGYAA